MQEPELNPAVISPQSFIVKFWLEDHEETKQWRGLITHVPSGQRQYLKNTHDILGFMVPFFKAMGIRFSYCWHLFHRYKSL